MDFLNMMKEKAKNDIQTIVLPESYQKEKRNLEAAAKILKENLANIILLGDKN